MSTFTELKKTVALAIPLIFTQLLGQAQPVVDTVMAGRETPAVLAAVALGAQISMIVFLFMLGIALEIRLERRSYGIALKYLVVRYALAVPFALAAWYLVPLDEPIRVVLCTLLFAPLGGMAPVLTSYVGGDLRLSNFILSASVVISVVAMPTVLVLLGA